VIPTRYCKGRVEKVSQLFISYGREERSDIGSFISTRDVNVVCTMVHEAVNRFCEWG